MNNQLFSLFVFISFFYSGIATEGVLISNGLYNESTYACLKARFSTEFVIIRSNILEKSNGFPSPPDKQLVIDTNAPSNIKNALRGINGSVDIFFDPHAHPSWNTSELLIKVLDYLDDNNANFDRVWLHIAFTSSNNNQWWTISSDYSIQIIEKLVNTLKKKNRKYGIFTKRDHWIEITGNTTKFSDAPLLYSSYNNKNNFDDYHRCGYAFGGWEDPEMKVFEEYRYICKAYVNLLWMP
ncbi:hypothetical protein ACQ4LE_010239 [Meloidogyne hapla]